MSNGEGQGMAVDSDATPFDAVPAKASERVVLRGVQVIVLDDLTEAVCEAFGLGDFLSSSSVQRREAWIAEALEPGSFDAAVEAHAGKSGEEGNKPGQYRAVKKAAWLEKGPRVIEPPLA